MSMFRYDASDDAAGTAALERGENAQQRSGAPEGSKLRFWRKAATMEDAARPRGSGNVVRSWSSAALTILLAMGAVVVTAPSAEADPVSIGDAAPFAVLAGSAVSNSNLTRVIGDLGTSPGSSVTGFPPGIVTGTIHAGDSTAANAKSDVVAAYNDLSGRPPNATVPAELGSTTKTPGVYASTTGNFQINGTLTLDAQANPDALFVFKAATLTAAMSSTVTLTGGAQADNLYWVISDSATLNTFTTFRGDLIASNAITVNTRANAIGRLFTLNNAITISGAGSEPATLLQLPDDRPTTTTLSTNNNPARPGQSITFTANVNPTSGTLVPQGDVAFKDGDTVLGTAFQSTTQPAVFTTSSLGAGQHRMTAVYLGGTTFDGENPVNFAPSTSPSINEVVRTSLWSNADAPDIASYPDASAVTLGVKFKASTSGMVTGIRFYKGSLNTGTHT
ncbi:ice-binding family protein, partial [Nonomuraea helvata]